MTFLVPAAIALAGLAYWQRDKVAEFIPSGAAMTKNDVRLALRAEAAAAGMSQDWFDAIGKVESGWVCNKINNAGGDALYGGSYGAMQMTAVTARRLGYVPESFLTDASLAGQAAAKYLSESSPPTFMDACAYWNAGVKRFTDLDYGGSTVRDYWPKAMDALAYVIANPPTGGVV